MKTIIFDFDGVIADSNDAVIKSLEQIAIQKKVTPISKEEHSNLSTSDMFKRLKIRWFQIPYYVMKARKLVKYHKNLIKVHHEFLVMIKKIYKNDLRFLILSSNSKDLILEFNHNNFPDIIFSEIYGSISLFSKHKIINKLLINHEKRNFIYIGDEVRDIVAAKRSGIKSIAVLWGKDKEKYLSESKPDFIAKTGHELSEILENFLNE